MSRRYSRIGASQLRERINVSEAQWFLSLPNKVRQRLFSAEEASIIAHKCEAVLQDPCFDSIHKLRQIQRLSCSGEYAISDSSMRASMNSVRTDSGLDMLPRQGLINSSRGRFEAPSKVIQKRKNSRRTQSSSMLSIPYPASRRKTQSHSVDSNEPFISIPRLPSRNELLVPLSSSSPSSSAQHGDAAEVTASQPRYYQDPEARWKLKTYFSSEQKFDELLQFGFPATAGTEESENRTGTPDLDVPGEKNHNAKSRKASQSYQRFMLADSLSALSDASSVELENDERGSNSSIDESDGPLTPTETTDATDMYIRYVGQLESKYSAVDIEKPLSDQRMLPPLPPLPPPSKSKPIAPGPAAHRRQRSKGTDSPNAASTIATVTTREIADCKNTIGPREMTLKISLTRSDLRGSESNGNDIKVSSEDEKHGGDEGGFAAHEADPLALQALPVVSDDTTGAHSPFTAQKLRLPDSVLQIFRGRFARR